MACPGCAELHNVTPVPVEQVAELKFVVKSDGSCDMFFLLV